MKNWTIGKRIIAGFAILILVAVALGVLAIINMHRSEAEARDVSEQQVPQVASGNAIERTTLNVMYQMRGYAYTENTNFLVLGEGLLDELKKEIADAKTSSVADVRTDAEKVSPNALEYEQLAQQTVAKTEAVQQNRRQLDEAARTFIESCNAYQDDMLAKMAVEIATNTPVDVLQHRLQKINLINDVMDAGNYCRISVWRSQAERDPQRLINGETNFLAIKTKLDELRPITTQAYNLKQLDDCLAAADAYKQAMNDLLGNWKDREDINTRRLAAATAVMETAKAASEVGLKDTISGANSVTTLMSSATRVLVIGLIAAVALGLGMALFTIRGITKILSKVALSLGDGSNQVSSAAAQVSASSQTLAEGSSEQASSLEETGSSLEEMASMTKRNSENAQKANDLAKQARSAADKGTSDMQTMNAAMDAIKVSSDDIAKIIKTIDEIAFQTNILALNAAVEAARAGEAGMGFAVVADEVRNLAQRSAQAAKETAGKIEGAIVKTAQGVGISKQVAETLTEIATKARQVDELVAEVASASREQTQGITQINVAVGQMDKVTQSNAANAEESAAAAEELNAQALTMKESVVELLQLVGGNSRGTVTRTNPAPAHANVVRHTASAKRSAPVHGNGHAHAEPALSGKTNGRSEIPLEGNFRDF